MNRSDDDWWSYWTAARTPFSIDGELDGQAWRGLTDADVLVELGLLLGSTGLRAEIDAVDPVTR